MEAPNLKTGYYQLENRLHEMNVDFEPIPSTVYTSDGVSVKLHTGLPSFH